MSDLRADFSRQEAALDLADASAALRWLARLHAEYWPTGDAAAIPEGLWDVGSYWNMSKRGSEATEKRMTTHWRTARKELAGLEGVHADLAARLCAAAGSVDEALHATEPEQQGPAE
eukprot:6780026-Prymnesium_polylepis.1